MPSGTEAEWDKNMKRERSVKIVATLGPASTTYDMIRNLHEAGADVFRLNMSHGSHEQLQRSHAIIRKVEEDLDSPIAILGRSPRPKIAGRRVCKWR